MKFIEIGKIRKPSGVEGSVKVMILPNFIADFLDADVLFLKIKGQKVPFFIEEVISGKDISINLEEVNNREKAAELTGAEVYIRAQDIKQASLDDVVLVDEFKYLENFTLQDKEIGTVGKITSVFEMPYQIMGIVAFDNREVYVPLNDDLILEVKKLERVVIMDLPAGLLDLQ